MAGDLPAINAAICTRLRGISGIGVVTGYEPFAQRREDFERFFKADSLTYILGWTVSREATEEHSDSWSSIMARHTMVARGYRAIGTDGTTETGFQTLIETIRDTFRPELENQLGGLVTFFGPVSVRLVEPRRFEEYGVHYAELVMPCTEHL